MERFIRIPISEDVTVRLDKEFGHLFVITLIGAERYGEITLTGDECLKLAKLIKDIVNDDGEIDFKRVKKQG